MRVLFFVAAASCFVALMAAVLSALSPARPGVRPVDPPVGAMRDPEGPLFSRRDAIAAGALALAAAALIPLDRGIDRVIRNTARPSYRRFKQQAVTMRPLQETVWFFAGLVLYGVGRLGGSARLADLGLHLSAAEVVASVLGHPWKWLVGRERPSAPNPAPTRFRPLYGFRDVAYRSFPSLHMVGNFTAASVITAEAARWWPRSARVVGPLTYGGAAYLGLLRMYDGAHWASDVIVGAAIGICSGTAVVRYLHAHPGNPVDRRLLVAVPPTAADR